MRHGSSCHKIHIYSSSPQYGCDDELWVSTCEQSPFHSTHTDSFSPLNELKYSGIWGHPTDENVGHRTHIYKVYHQNADAYVPAILAHPYYNFVEHGCISHIPVCTDFGETWSTITHTPNTV